jgi:GxxExxY protein
MISENKISYDCRGAAFRIYNQLGPGLLESVYEHTLCYELIKSGYHVKRQLGLPVYYDGIKFDLGFRIDILVNDLMIIEVKSVEILMEVHKKQLLTYLKLSNKKLGLLINFNTSDLNHSIVRVVNGL